MTGRKATRAKARTVRPPYILYRVLTPPDMCHYVFGFLTRSNVPMLYNTPIIVFEGEVVAILSERCIIETAQDRMVVFSPPRGDVSWYARHPADGCNPFADDEVA